MLTYLYNNLYVVRATELLPIVTIVSSTSVFPRILYLEVLKSQKAVIRGEDDVLGSSPSSECPQIVINVVVNQRTWVAISRAVYG